MQRIEYVCYTCKPRKNITSNMVKKEQEQSDLVHFFNRKTNNDGIIFTENSIFYKLHIDLDGHDWRVYQIID